MLKIRRPLGRLIFNMGIATPGKTVFLIETAPRFSTISIAFHKSVVLVTPVPMHWSYHSLVLNMIMIDKRKALWDVILSLCDYVVSVISVMSLWSMTRRANVWSRSAHNCQPRRLTVCRQRTMIGERLVDITTWWMAVSWMMINPRSDNVNHLNSLWPSGVIWHHRIWLTLVQVIWLVACVVPSHYLNQCRLTCT